MKRFRHIVLLSIAVALLGAGCRGMQTAGEKAARKDLASVTKAYRPERNKSNLPALTDGAGMSNFLAYAVLNSPNVEAAFDDWAGSVERITVERSLPDPKLTFQAYIQNDLTSLMPGLMQDLPGPGKLSSTANVATAESRAKYFAFESAVLQAAFDFKSAYYNLYFLDERIRINRQMLTVLTNLEESALAQNEAGKGTLQDVLRAQIERARIVTDVAHLEHSQDTLLAQFKATLGLTQEQPDPPMPAFESTTLDLDLDELLATAFERNPKLKQAEAEVRLAEASIEQERKSKVPDFSAGLQAEVYEPPFYWPQASMTLPVWRDKIAAQIAAAGYGKRGARARLSAAQLNLTVDFAMKTHNLHETTRNLRLLDDQLIPKARESYELARANYLSGRIDFFNLMDAERTWLNFQLEAVQERTSREIELADLSLTIAGVAPAGAPVLATSPNGAPDRAQGTK